MITSEMRLFMNDKWEKDSRIDEIALVDDFLGTMRDYVAGYHMGLI